MPSSTELLQILYRDDDYIAIHKPAKLLVHRTALSRDTVFALQRLRDQIGRRVFTVHRLDRATSGVLVFALSAEAARHLCQRFENREVDKEYLAVVRGHIGEQGCIDYPLAEEKHKPLQPAVTRFRRLATAELPLAVGRYASARYSLVRLYPETGRMHQIRRHLNRINHPVIGDVNHGDRHHNHFFQAHFDMDRLLLLATQVRFRHPYTGHAVEIRAPLPDDVAVLLQRLGWRFPL